MALKSVDDIDSNGFDDNSLLLKLYILLRTLETFLRTITEGQEVKTILNLGILREINPLK